MRNHSGDNKGSSRWASTITSTFTVAHAKPMKCGFNQANQTQSYAAFFLCFPQQTELKFSRFAEPNLMYFKHKLDAGYKCCTQANSTNSFPGQTMLKTAAA